MLEPMVVTPVPDGALRLWQKIVELRTWSVIVDPDALRSAALDELLGPEPRSFCARIAADDLQRAHALAWDEPWALLVDVTNLSRVRLAALTQRHHVLGLDLRTDRVVRLPGGNGELLEAFLGGAWIHSGDCIVASEAAAGRLAGRPEVVA